MAVADAPQAARVAELLKARKLPLLVSVNFDPPRRRATFGDDDEDKERHDIEEAERNPAELHQAGRPLRARLRPTRPTSWPACARRSSAACRATPRCARSPSAAAEVLGVADRLGSLEAGKIANVVVWSGEPLAKDAKAKMVFVDGELYEPDEKPKPSPSPGAPSPAASPSPAATTAPTPSPCRVIR